LYVDALSTGKLEAIIHSHTYVLNGRNDYHGTIDQRVRSMADMKSQEGTNLPWGICSTEGEIVSKLLWTNLEIPEPLLGRVYINSVYDCYTLVRDYYRINMNIKFGLYPRPVAWEKFDPTMFEANFENEGFVKLASMTDMQVGDILLFKIARGKRANHIGVVSRPDYFYHHLSGRNQLSKEDMIGPWMKQLVAVCRHKSRLK
jgi:cell wall-associated NlpC family hydrolase